jgi:hypothetical protein
MAFILSLEKWREYLKSNEHFLAVYQTLPQSCASHQNNLSSTIRTTRPKPTDIKTITNERIYDRKCTYLQHLESDISKRANDIKIESNLRFAHLEITASTRLK